MLLFNIMRCLGYTLGFLLFYAPCALLQRAIYYIINGEWVDMSIHNICFRIPIEHILDGKILTYPLSYTLATYLLLLSALVFGPIFCGRLCPAGAFSEFVGKIMPERFKIDWSKHTDIAPIRYGMLMGYVLLPFFGGVAACAFCNYYLFDLMINYVCQGYFVSLTSSMILTSFLWLIIFGLFTKGGRGFCNFLCPVGAMLSFMHRLGSYLPMTFGMQVDKNKCIGCVKCEQSCPMMSIKIEDRKAQISKDNCICCGVCSYNCPCKAIHYGRKAE